MCSVLCSNQTSSVLGVLKVQIRRQHEELRVRHEGTIHEIPNNCVELNHKIAEKIGGKNNIFGKAKAT